MCCMCEKDEWWANSGWLVVGRRQWWEVILYHTRGDDLCGRQSCHVLQGFVLRRLILQKGKEGQRESQTANDLIGFCLIQSSNIQNPNGESTWHFFGLKEQLDRMKQRERRRR